MNTLWPLVNLLGFAQFVACRDFYLGMFRRNDLLVAQDVIYKAPSPFGYTTASYGRLFKCPITYFRVVDRLGMGRGPFTTIVRGGLKKKFINVRIKSTYRLPVSVNIYVGCENKQPSTLRTVAPITLTTRIHEPTESTASKVDEKPGGKKTKNKSEENTTPEKPKQNTTIESNDNPVNTTIGSNDNPVNTTIGSNDNSVNTTIGSNDNPVNATIGLNATNEYNVTTTANSTNTTMGKANVDEN